MSTTVDRNICIKYRLQIPKSWWETPPKVVKNNKDKVLCDFQLQSGSCWRNNWRRCEGKVQSGSSSNRSTRAVDLKLEEWLEQIQGTTSKVCVQSWEELSDSRAELSDSQPSGRGPELKHDTHTTPQGVRGRSLYSTWISGTMNSYTSQILQGRKEQTFWFCFLCICFMKSHTSSQQFYLLWIFFEMWHRTLSFHSEDLQVKWYHSPKTAFIPTELNVYSLST